MTRQDSDSNRIGVAEIDPRACDSAGLELGPASYSAADLMELSTDRFSDSLVMSTSRSLTASNANERGTRFNGLKQECGIHLPDVA